MKIMVTHKNRTTEIITLTEPLQILRGPSMNRLVCSTGMEHWFNEDGTYDGWGMRVQNISPEDATDLIKRTEADREKE